jgi:hypothetical protein
MCDKYMLVATPVPYCPYGASASQPEIGTDSNLIIAGCIQRFLHLFQVAIEVEWILE